MGNIILDPEDEAFIGNRRINLRSVNGMSVYKKNIPGLQRVRPAFNMVGGFAGEKDHYFMKIMIMPGKLPAGLIPEMKKAEGFVEISCFFGWFISICEKHLSILLSISYHLLL